MSDTDCNDKEENEPSPVLATPSVRDLLSPRDLEWVEETVARLGPLTQEEREFLAMIFQNRR